MTTPPSDAAGANDEATSPRARRRLQDYVTAGIIFGLVGMITGGLSLYVTWRTSSEEAAVVLEAYPTASPDDLTHAGFGVRVQLVNESLRPVIVQNATLWVDDHELTSSTGYLADSQLLDQSATNPAAISDARLDFPLSMNAREGRSAVFLMDVWRPVVTAEGTAEELVARRKLNQFLTSVGSLATGSDRHIELGLELAPGGLQRFDVRGVSEPSVYPEAIRDASAIQRQAPLQTWLVEPQLNRGELDGLALRRRFATGGQVDLVQLDVWNVRSQFHERHERPVLGQQTSLFPLELPTGAYVATFRLGGDVIAHRSFTVPWSETSCELQNAMGPVWCAQTRSG
jgi:hypothetical protein